MRVFGIIVAGGKGLRLGGDKPLAPFRGATLLDAVIARVRPQVEELGLNVPAQAAPRYRGRYRHELVADAEPGDVGPLAGILAGLAWAEARGADWLATFPADTPFLPRDLVADLLAIAARSPPKPAAARDAGGLQGLCAVWPVARSGELVHGVRLGGLRSLREALAQLGGVERRFDADPHAFLNVNTPQELARAEAIASEVDRPA